MKIAVVLPHLELFGGIRRVLELTNRLVTRGHDVALLLPDGVERTCDWMDVAAEVLTMPAALDRPVDVALHVDERQWHLVQAMPHAAVRGFYALHDGAAYDKPGSWEAPRADLGLLLANSRWTADQVHRRTGRRPEVLLGGVDRDQFSPRGVARRTPVLCTGDPRPWKGTATVRAACRALDLPLAELRAMGLRQDELADAYAAAEVFVVGSTVEGFGQPGLEALACGTPLVTTDNGGSAEYAVHEETALVVPPDDVDAMAAAIRRLRTDADLRDRLVANGLALVEGAFDWDDAADRFEGLLAAAVRGETDPGPADRGTAIGPDDQPEVSVVVLAWDQLHHTQPCVDSIRRHTDVPHEVVLVDNGSAWDARAYAARAGDVAVLHDRNEGFARGMNAGLARARADHVLFLNNDTTLPAGWASRLLATRRSTEAGIVTPAVTAARNPRTVRDAPGEGLEVLDPFEPPPSAVAWLMATATARALGGFDERYRIASGEDVDLAFKVWVNDLDVVHDPAVLVDHVGKGTAGTKLPNWRQLWRENGQLLVDSWRTPDPDRPRLDHVAPERFDRNLRTAAAVAGWMDRYYQVRERRIPFKGTVETAVQRVRSVTRDPVVRHRVRRRLDRVSAAVRRRVRW